MLPKELRIQGANQLEEFIKTSNLCNNDSQYVAQRYGKNRSKQQINIYNSMIEYLKKDYDIEELNRNLGEGGWRNYNYKFLLQQTLVLDKTRRLNYKKVFPHLPDIKDLI